MIQKYSKILVDNELPRTFSGLYLFSDIDGGLKAYCDCSSTGKHLQLTFDRVHAYTSHEDFSHPDTDKMNKALSEPPPSWEDSEEYYPALCVENSVWRNTFPDYRVGFSDTVHHYKFISFSNIVDVLFSGELVAKYMGKAEIAKIKQFACEF